MKPGTRLEKILLKFIATEKRKDRFERFFDLADERGRSGFENWLKFELAMYLLQKKIKVDIERQVQVNTLLNLMLYCLDSGVRFKEIPN